MRARAGAPHGSAPLAVRQAPHELAGDGHRHPLSAARAEIDGRRERLRAPRPKGLLYTSRSVTIMANCVPCLFRKTGPGTGSGWLPASDEIGSA
jgi:hypothetical protein